MSEITNINDTVRHTTSKVTHRCPPEGSEVICCGRTQKLIFYIRDRR